MIRDKQKHHLIMGSVPQEDITSLECMCQQQRSKMYVAETNRNSRDMPESAIIVGDF
jgi:hypothetical protein